MFVTFDELFLTSVDLTDVEDGSGSFGYVFELIVLEVAINATQTQKCQR